METQSSTSTELTADRVAFWAILIVIFLSPLFFIPSAYVPFQFAKVVLLYAGIAVAFCACIIARLKDGVIKTPWHYLYISLSAIPVVYALAALFSPVRRASLMGQGFEIGTLSFIVAATLFALFVAYFFTTKGRIAYAYFAFLVPVPLVMLFQLIRLLAGPNVLTLNAFFTSTASLLGGWNDLGIYFGAAALFAFIALELLELDRWLKWTFGILLALSLFFLSVVNFTSIWYLLGSLALIFFVYNFSFTASRSQQEADATGEAVVERRVPVTSLLVIIVAVVFILLQGNLYATLPFLHKFSVQNIEVRPSWMGTWDVIKSSLRSHPIFGIGPNRFTNAWLSSKPDGVNATIFWNTDFNYGVGLIPTFIATTGILGLLSWLAFFALFLWAGFKALFIKTEDPFLRYTTVSSFILALYLWIFTIIYVPSAALLILTFFFTGVFLAALTNLGIARVYSFNFVRDPRLSFGSVLIFIALLLAMLAVGYTITRKFVAAIYFNKAIASVNVRGDAGAAESQFMTALQLSQDDQFYRTLAAFYLFEINRLVAQPNASQDVLQNQLRAYLGNAQNAALNAVAIDKTNYQNWLSLGQVFETVVPLNINGAYENALAAYQQAQSLNPQNPAIPLVIARLDVAHKDIAKAKQDINTALSMKSNYTDALFFEAQILANEGDLNNAIQAAQQAAYLNPNDSGIYFELGLLRYDNKDYAGAASAFQQAIAITPDYANAQYFLGLSYAKLNERDLAIKEFQAILNTNPGNSDVTKIIDNLQAGRDALAGFNPPANQPEKSPNPPVKDSTTKQATPDTQGR